MNSQGFYDNIQNGYYFNLLRQQQQLQQPQDELEQRPEASLQQLNENLQLQDEAEETNDQDGSDQQPTTKMGQSAKTTESTNSDVKKKAGRPTSKAKKNEASRAWTDEETIILIEAWAGYENLYNTSHKNYYNRDLRQKSLEAIVRSLAEKEIVASVKQISKKLTDLKNYYGGQKRLTESSKASGAGADDVFVSPWKFYDNLVFLSDAFTPRKTKSNAIEESDGDSPYTGAKPPSSKAAKKIAEAQTNELHKMMATTTSALQSVIAKRSEKPSYEDSDDSFGALLAGELRKIPECDLKDELKISLQQMILKCKRQVNSFNTLQGNRISTAAIGNPYQQNQRNFLGSPPSPQSSLNSPRSMDSSFGQN